jgi:exocyst complex component 2
MLESLRWRMQEVIAATWARGMPPLLLKRRELINQDAKNLHLLEDWTPSPGQKGTTRYLDILQDFQLRILGSSHKVASRAGDARKGEESVPPISKKKIKETFVETLCFLFDGILSGAMATPQVDNRRPSRVSNTRVVTVRDIVCLLLTLTIPSRRRISADRSGDKAIGYIGQIPPVEGEDITLHLGYRREIPRYRLNA